MDIAAAFASGCTISPAAGPTVEEEESDVGDGSSAEPQLAIPVHVVIAIMEKGAIDFGIDHVNPSLVSPRPCLNPGMQVVQLTITGCFSQKYNKVS